MPNIVLNKADRFPVGTVVGLYPAYACQHGGPPTSSTVTTATVANDGSLTFTGAVAETPYVAAAMVGTEYRRVFARVSPFAPRSPWPWQQVVANRRALAGTS